MTTPTYHASGEAHHEAAPITDKSTSEPISEEVLDPFNFPDYRNDDLMVTGLGLDITRITEIYQAIVINGVDDAFGDFVEGLKDVTSQYLFAALGDSGYDYGEELPRSDDMNTLAIVAACLLLEWNRL